MLSLDCKMTTQMYNSLEISCIAVQVCYFGEILSVYTLSLSLPQGLISYFGMGRLGEIWGMLIQTS